MSNCLSIDTRACSKADNLSANQEYEDKNNNTELSSLKEGQRITGKVISVKDKVVLNFGGQEITASKSVFKNVKPGDVKNFEVVKADDKEIELRLLDEADSGSVKTIKALRNPDTDLGQILAKNEQTAKKEDQETEYTQVRNNLQQVSSLLTEQDLKLLEQEGFPIEDYTAEGLAKALKRIKTEESQTDGNSGQKMTSFDKTALAKRLKDENLPVTEENLNKLSTALGLSGLITNMDDKTMQYLIGTDSEPSVENIYKAYYSSKTQNTSKLSDAAWSQLKNQVEDVIRSAGYEVNEANLTDAKWLIENNLPMTEDTFTYKKNLENIRSDADQDDILNRMLVGMKEGINPKDVSLMPEDNTNANKIVSDINSISDEAIAQGVRQDNDLTIRRLVTIQDGLALAGNPTQQTKDMVQDPDTESESGDNNEDKETPQKDYEYEEIKARRQLEEIRLKMTTEAAGTLNKKGFSIETEQLSKVVDELRNLEDEYYRNLLQEADADPTQSSVQTLKETTQSIEQLKFLPSSILGSTLSQRNTQTITGLLTQGSNLAAEYAKAGTAYETLATVPNTEYGDSLKKAFANADSLLSQMNLDLTEENRRAVRILGYNHMEVNETSINQVKAYDKQVTALIQNLHPAVTVRMIKDGINPMSMPINELNTTIDHMKEEQGITSEDKYSTYLRNLEKQQGITDEERKAYIGIYRLLYNVDKSDGAAIGAVIKSDREVTLGSLLTAVQTNKKGSIDSIVNDEFGSIQSVSYQGESIAEQLSSFHGREGQQYPGQSSQNDPQNQDNSSENTPEEQTQYVNRILKQIKDELSPQKLMEAGNSINRESMLQNQSLAAASEVSSDKGLWEKIKGVPVEKLLEQLRNTQDAEDADRADAGTVQEIRELCRNSEQSIRFLNDYRMPCTSLNISMANNILSNGDSPIKKLLKLNNENQNQNTKNNLKEINDLSDTLNDKNSIQDVYKQLDTDAKDMVKHACSEEVIDSRRLADLKGISRQMTFLTKLAGREFYQIPIETSKGITNMNLTILRGSDTSGKVSVNLKSETIGNIKAEFTLKDQVLKGYFGCDNQNGLKQIKADTSEIENAARAGNVAIKQLDFGMQSREKDNYSYQNPNYETGKDTVSDNTERLLYRIAKAVVQTVRTAENNSTE